MIGTERTELATQRPATAERSVNAPPGIRGPAWKNSPLVTLRNTPATSSKSFVETSDVRCGQRGSRPQTDYIQPSSFIAQGAFQILVMCLILSPSNCMT